MCIHRYIHTNHTSTPTWPNTQHMITWYTEKHKNWDNINISTSPSAQFSHSVMSNSLWPQGLQHTRLPCPSPTPRAYSQIHNHRVGDAFQPSHSLSSPSTPTFNLSQHQGLFQWVSSLHQVLPAYWCFGFSISPSNEYSGLISFRMDWLDLLAIQRSQVFSNTTVQKHQCFHAQLSL